MTCALRNLARRHQQQVCQCLQDRRCRGRGRGAVRAVVQVQAELTRRRLLLLREGSGSAGHAYPPRESIPHRMTQAGRDALDRVSVQATARLREQQPAGRFPCVRNRRHRTSRGAKSGRTPAVPRPAQSPIRACVPHRARVKPARKEGAKDIRSANHAVGMWNESRSPRRPRKTKRCPANGSCFNTASACAASAVNPLRMSVTPAASQTRVFAGTGITPIAPGSAEPALRDHTRR